MPRKPAKNIEKLRQQSSIHMPLKQIMYGFQGKRPLLFIDGTVQRSYHRPATPILYRSNNTNIWGTSVWWMEEPLGNVADKWTEDHTRDGTKTP